MSGFSRPLFLAPLFALGALTGCSSTEPAKAPYSVYLDYGCTTDIEHEAYDPALPGYWLVGTAARIQVSLGKDATTPDEFVFNIRTRATATKDDPSRLERVLILTPRYRIITGFGRKGAAPVDIISYLEKKEGVELVPVESDKEGRFISFEQDGERVKVKLTKRGLALLGPDFTFTWAETVADAKAIENDKAKAALRERRVL